MPTPTPTPTPMPPLNPAKDRDASASKRHFTHLFSKKDKDRDRDRDKDKDKDRHKHKDNDHDKDNLTSSPNSPPTLHVSAASSDLNTILLQSTNSSSTRAQTPASPPRPHRRNASSARHSILSGAVGDFSSSLRRSASLRTSSSTSSHKPRSPSTATLALHPSPEKAAPAHAPTRPTLSISTFARKPKSADNVRDVAAALSPTDLTRNMFAGTVPLRYPPSGKSAGPYGGNGVLGPAAPLPSSGSAAAVNPHAIYQNIHETASKRISTLDYLRKAHDGRIYWFNTLLFTRTDLHKPPHFDPRRLARRATTHLLLGFSLPATLDLHTHSAPDYLRALNALLAEFETYATLHSPDTLSAGGPGSSSSSSTLSRARLPQMFKRSGTKSRRSSSATAATISSTTTTTTTTSSTTTTTTTTTTHPSDLPPITDESFPHAAVPDTPGLPPQAFSSSSSAVGAADDDASAAPTPLAPGEEYTHLLTPHLPFDPDHQAVFATLCDALIDVYTTIIALVGASEASGASGAGAGGAGGAGPGAMGANVVLVGELFQKADARVRKLVLGPVVREFEQACREGVGREVRGVGGVVLGGLV